MSGFGTDEGFGLKIERFRQLASASIANKRAQRAKAAPAAPPAQARKPARFGLEPEQIEIPHIEDLIDPGILAEKIINAGRASRGEMPIATPTPSGVAASVLAAGDLARAGGPQRPVPEGLAKQIIEAGVKRRRPMGS